MQDLRRVTALITLSAIAFYGFFQLNKGGPFRQVNPFAEDPYDALGSMAIQVALLVGVLTYARAVRVREDPTHASKLRLILRGNALVLFAVWATLIADAIAEVVQSRPLSDWGIVLVVELASMILLTSACTVALALSSRRIMAPPAPRDLTPADGIDDLWILVRIPVSKLGSLLPHGFLEWADGFSSDRLFGRARWLNPRHHPWRFASALGFLAGIGLALAKLQEGLPPNLRIGLLVAGVLITVELSATLLGFTLFGGYLGLRPPL